MIDTVGGLAQMTGKLRPRSNPDAGLAPAGEPAGGLEARLAGVVVAALKEAFDRDRARMIQRAQLEAERKRADEALAAELRRQAAEQALGQLRIIAIMAITGWMLSAALAAWLPGMRGVVPRSLLGAGWLFAFGALGSAFAGAQAISASAVGTGGAARRSRNGGTVAVARRAGRDCRESAGCPLAMPSEAPSIPSTGPTTSSSEDS